MVTCVHCGKAKLGGCDCGIREILAHHQKRLDRLEKMLPMPPMPDPTEEAFKVWCKANGFPAVGESLLVDHAHNLRIFRGGADWIREWKEPQGK